MLSFVFRCHFYFPGKERNEQKRISFYIKETSFCQGEICGSFSGGSLGKQLSLGISLRYSGQNRKNFRTLGAAFPNVTANKEIQKMPLLGNL
jgi:hypothetical protein